MKYDITIKTQKKFPEFVKEVDGLSIEDLSTRLVVLSKGLSDNAEARENDGELADASSKHSQLKAPYDDFKKAALLKQRYIRNLIKEKGGE